MQRTAVKHATLPTGERDTAIASHAGMIGARMADRPAQRSDAHRYEHKLYTWRGLRNARARQLLAEYYASQEAS